MKRKKLKKLDVICPGCGGREWSAGIGRKYIPIKFFYFFWIPLMEYKDSPTWEWSTETLLEQLEQ